jgi:hypothetical protein
MSEQSLTVPSTPIVELYAELHEKGVGRARRLARAEEFVATPSSLAERFGDSVTMLAAYLLRNEGFYHSRRRYEVGDVSASSTTDLALRVRDAGGLWPAAAAGAGAGSAAAQATVPGVSAVAPADLACEYLDRELVATWTTGGARHDGIAVRLDLLLCNATDRTPIVAEVKRTAHVDPAQPHRKPSTDKDAFSALIQALACTAQLATPAQYARLARWGRAESNGAQDRPASADIDLGPPPVFDIYVILHNRPTGTYLPELGAMAERLAVLLLGEPPVARHVRRIACLLTRLERDALCAEVDWAYERTPPATERIEAEFGDYFRRFGITLPGPAALERAPGSLRARGWSIRWRWRPDGHLEFRASHCMTNERWEVISTDGRRTAMRVPPEMMVFGPGDDRHAVETEYNAAWQAHGEAAADAGMKFDDEEPPASLRPNEGRLTWRLDAGPWRTSALPPRDGGR